MEIYKIICPQCGSRFTLKVPNPNALVNKTFKCPKCGYSSGYPELLSNATVGHASLPGQNSPMAAPGNHTQIASPGNQGNLVLTVQTTGMRFALAEGQYTLGRDSADSKASLRLAPDPYMSRLHAGLVVARGKARITNQSNTSPIGINGQALKFGHSAYLNNGDNLQIGATDIKVNFQ